MDQNNTTQTPAQQPPANGGMNDPMPTAPTTVEVPTSTPPAPTPPAGDQGGQAPGMPGQNPTS